MAKNTSVTLGDHYTNFITTKIKEGRFECMSEAVRAGLRLLEEQETKLENLRRILVRGEAQLDNGEGFDGDTFISELLN